MRTGRAFILQTRLPDPAGAELPVVVVRSAGGHLLLSGVGPGLLEQLQKTHRVDLRDAVTVVPAPETILESTQKALDDGEVWLAGGAA